MSKKLKFQVISHPNTSHTLGNLKPKSHWIQAWLFQSDINHLKTAYITHCGRVAIAQNHIPVCQFVQYWGHARSLDKGEPVSGSSGPYVCWPSTIVPQSGRTVICLCKPGRSTSKQEHGSVSSLSIQQLVSPEELRLSCTSFNQDGAQVIRGGLLHTDLPSCIE